MRSYDSAPRPSSIPSPVSKLSLILGLPVCRYSSFLTEEGREGVSEEPNHTTARKPGPLKSFNTLWTLRLSLYIAPFPPPPRVSGQDLNLGPALPSQACQPSIFLHPTYINKTLKNYNTFKKSHYTDKRKILVHISQLEILLNKGRISSFLLSWVQTQQPPTHCAEEWGWGGGGGRPNQL